LHPAPQGSGRSAIAVYLRAKHDDRVRRPVHRLPLATPNEPIGRERHRAAGCADGERAVPGVPCDKANSATIHSC
jgi:hypothetical protein